MKIKGDATTVALGVIGGGIVLYFGYLMYRTNQARKEQDHQVLDVAGVIVDDNPWADGNGEHYVPANALLGPQTVLPMRYPTFVGKNVSILAANGFQPLYRSMPQDYDYLVSPPSEGA